MKPRLALAAAFVLAVGVLLVPIASAATRPTCQVLGPGIGSHATLQSAVDAASAGDTLRVKGTCVGTTTIGKSLTIVGQSNPAFGPATLDADHAGRVVTIGAGTTVALIDLMLIHGTATWGGGILIPGLGPGGVGANVTLTNTVVTDNAASVEGGGIDLDLHGNLTLNGDSSVHGNTAPSGGGIFSARATVVLDDTSSVYGNAALAGGGIYSASGPYPALILNDSSSIHDNTASGGGGGILNADGGTELNDASSVYGNTAGGTGGGIQNQAHGLVRINDQGSIHGNTAGTTGGGVWSGQASTLTNCVAGANVLENVPDDIFTTP